MFYFQNLVKGSRYLHLKVNGYLGTFPNYSLT